jgi:2-polyprenyl-3-methyl-5-hydroxy-6-metoxy-1,4-benzoquinol methylase
MSNNSILIVDELIRKKQYEKAENICLNMLNEDEKNNGVFEKLEEIYLQMGKEIEAQILLEEDDESGENLFSSGKLYNKIKSINKKLELEKTPNKNICWCGGNLQSSVHELYSKCELCGTHVVKQKYTKEELKKFYTLSNYWHEHQTFVSGFPPIEVRAKNDFNDRIPYWYELVNKYCLQKDTLLEIGCAHGGFLYYCNQNGIKNVVGVEVDEETCKFVRQQFNLPYVYSGLFPNVKLPFLKFDVITGFDVIEHFNDPIEGIKAISNLLSDEGRFIFQTPCYRGENRTWSQFKPAEHIFLYNENSIKQLFIKCGLEIMTILPGYFPDDMFVIGRKQEKNKIILDGEKLTKKQVQLS